ncbi:MAG: hypothetical protein H7Z73_08595 [Candidatus Saccharibacteria bacterium]|nr:hypothetical protein [Moraxellaceae bacterium]
MRLYTFEKIMFTQLAPRLYVASLNVRLALLATMASCAIFTHPAAYAEDQSETTPAANSLEAFATPKTPAKNDIELVNRPLIAGLWGMRIPNVACIEYYNFKENGQFLVKSANEWSLGKYAYQLPEMEVMAKSLPQLTMGILYDSDDIDCSGNQVNQTGEVQQEFVKWISPSHIQFCAAIDGKQCPLELYRVLP